MHKSTQAKPRRYLGMGANLGFIEKVILADGTVVENLHVLRRSPIPTKEQFELILRSANEASRQILGAATPEWSSHPELEPKRLFQDDQALSEIAVTGSKDGWC